MNHTRPRRSLLRWASEYVVTAERAGSAFLAMATVLLVVAYCLPWWSVTYEGGWLTNRTVTTYGFSGWGWLSFAAGLVALALTVRIASRKRLDKRLLAWATFVAGLAELLGNALFTVMATKTEIFISVALVATRGIGLTIAMVAGGMLIVSGLLMLTSRNRHAPASEERRAAHIMVR